ncbi:DUF2877 domain-containing protein [Nocardioides sp. KIGAM211]|uniref:DUF2877 domain-containing protein n=1 Tax=Nocardioides luti TaxID=2761101 RepID=A0A7X0RIQ6_9ACTN|nr:DUF2877 domain-containing protein [Nocardioides luti]MBB6629071.1 DUF2877 domain-containing protein [Nocardioides luti]
MPSPSVLAVSAPDRVRRRLAAAPDGPRRVLHRGRHAVYVDLDGRCVGLVAASATQVPCALRSSTPDLVDVPGGSAYLRGGVLHLDGTPLVVGRVHDVRVARPDSEGAFRNTAGSVFRQATPPAPVAELVGGGPALRIDAASAARLVGLGGGLTPLGDDLLCGWLALHRAAGVATPAVDAAVTAALPRTTLLSATLLECALLGEALPELSAYVVALGTPREAAAAAALLAVGHTSGAGLLHGAHLALADLARTDAAHVPAPSPDPSGAAA